MDMKMNGQEGEQRVLDSWALTASSEEKAKEAFFSRKASWFPSTEGNPSPRSQVQSGNKDMEKITLRHSQFWVCPTPTGHLLPRPGAHNALG